VIRMDPAPPRLSALYLQDGIGGPGHLTPSKTAAGVTSLTDPSKESKKTPHVRARLKHSQSKAEKFQSLPSISSCGVGEFLFQIIELAIC
jgi:hypothetical protein